MQNSKSSSKNLIQDKSFQFALHVLELYKQMRFQKEYIISAQLIRSGTSIGANVEEATAAQTKKDFIAKMSVASKEARETRYWLKLLSQSQFFVYDYTKLMEECNELIRIITAIVKTAQTKGESEA
ncbi:MAG: four helix bundle protein [Bacteroidetes bacterium]|nr:four helix bundle protein [Bacteroidota bacterium]